MVKREDPKKKPKWDEFECPECSAHNPYGNGFTFDDEIFCAYCGNSYLVKRAGDGETYKLTST